MFCAFGSTRGMRGWAIVGMATLTTSALAGATAFHVTAINANGTASFAVEVPDASSFEWRLGGPVELRDASTNALVATLTGASASVNPDDEPVGERGPMVNPQVNLGFAVQAGTMNTQFMISSALVSFAPMSNVEGRASAAYTVTDLNSNGATLTGLGPANGGYLAQYNGFVPAGTTFAEGINSIAAAFGSGFGSVNVPPIGFLPVPGVVSDMSAQVAFELTAGDFASGTTNYILTPEPATLVLLGLAAISLRRR